MFISKEFKTPTLLTQSFARSFLLLGGENSHKQEEFVIVLTKMIQYLHLDEIQIFLLLPYTQFFDMFIPNQKLNTMALKILFALAMKIRADMKWLCYRDDSLSIIIDHSYIHSENANTVA
jgi:hypothetical protein